ncbi:MAG: hypothetical protein ACOX5A_05515 [Aminivibrio sp.]|jgi:hypothetical protein
MNEKGSIVCSEVIDDTLELQLWTKDKAPRLVIVNRAKKTRKLTPLSWLEGADRKLAMRGPGGKTVSYAMEVLEEPVRRMLLIFAQNPVFKGLLWHSTLFLSDLLNSPRSVFEKSELALLPEEKRSRLWLADMTDGEEEGRFRPFFPLSGEEAEVFGGGLSVPATAGKGGADLKSSGITRKLASVCPARWYDTARTAAAAALLGFSLFHEEGDGFSSFLWAGAKNGIPSKEHFKEGFPDPVLARFVKNMAGYVRHWAVLDKISVESVLDAYEELTGRGFARKRRLELPAGALGNTDYTVTVYMDEEGTMAAGCAPRQATDRHRGELVFSMPAAVYGQALKDDSFGGAEDDYFTLATLLQARLYDFWRKRVDRFAGVFLNPGG